MAGQNELRRDPYLDLLMTIAKEGESPQSQAKILDALLDYFGPRLRTCRLIEVGDVECGLGYVGSGRHLSEDKPKYVGRIPKTAKGLFFLNSYNNRLILRVETKTQYGRSRSQIWGIAKVRGETGTAGEWALFTVHIREDYKGIDRADLVTNSVAPVTSADLLKLTGLSVSEIFAELADETAMTCERRQRNLEWAQSLNLEIRGAIDLLKALNA